MAALRYDEATGLPSHVMLTVEDMRGRRPDPNERPAGVLKLQFRDAEGFDVMLILTDVSQVQQLRQLLT